MQAVYQPENIGHFGLALGHYAHFTSPIRRYPDLVVHRTLRALLSNSDPYGVRYDGGQLAIAGTELTRSRSAPTSRIATVNAWLKCVYLRDRIGQTFEGLITTVVEFGAFVQLTSVGVDGLLHIDNLRDDEYHMEAGGRAWVGKSQQAPARHGHARARHRDQRESHRGAGGPGAGGSGEGRGAAPAEIAASGREAAAHRRAGGQA